MVVMVVVVWCGAVVRWCGGGVVVVAWADNGGNVQMPGRKKERAKCKRALKKGRFLFIF